MRSQDHLSILILPLLFGSAAHASGATSVFINQVVEYANLSPCAAQPVSTIVRDMENGCGDGGKTTSLSCFCFQSSAHFASVISKSVALNCNESDSQVTTALDVFDEYCSLGTEYFKTATPTSASANATSTATSQATTTTAALATPAAVASSSDATSTTAILATTAAAASGSDATKGTLSSSSSKSKTAAIAAGVAVPLGVILISLGIFFLWRRQQQRSMTRIDSTNDPRAGHLANGNDDSYKLGATPIKKGVDVELEENLPQLWEHDGRELCELEAWEKPAELPAKSS
ncbi:hypothetical protein N7495_004384 [Penicillium taxi]|uniref:uncharacterized protein n=1 Tax=Penicillium taxi TaxID=168475 RepID=UPI0025450D72|nr:uncharacterized protein N7495_004384 [Penicillium taxi]KAJ5899640.1 hypothetical protein N7495_004384 [Penicillium taxi]